MTVRRSEDAIFLEDLCPVEDAEPLIAEVQAGATLIDWQACTHLHTACLQVLLVAGLPVRGLPANPDLARWVPSLLTAALLSDARAEA
jgi:hypothetical protein